MSSSSSLSSINHPQGAATINHTSGGTSPPPPLSSADRYQQPQPVVNSHSFSGLDSLDGGGSHSSDDLDLGPGLGQGLGLDSQGYLLNHSATEGEGDVGSLEESSHWDDLLGEGNDGDSYTLGNDGGVGGSSQYLGGQGQHDGQGLGMAQGMGGSMSHHGLQRIPYQERYHIITTDTTSSPPIPHHRHRRCRANTLLNPFKSNV